MEFFWLSGSKKNPNEEPLFPFGYGLSYTTFEYSTLKIEPKETDGKEKVRIYMNIKNTGKYKGDEVIQLYIHDLFSSIARPLKELKGFKRVTLEPDETKKVEFVISREDLVFYDAEMNLVLEPGLIKVMIGSSSGDIRLKGEFIIK